jgi:hypothetical protein
MFAKPADAAGSNDTQLRYRPFEDMCADPFSGYRTVKLFFALLALTRECAFIKGSRLLSMQAQTVQRHVHLAGDFDAVQH